MNAKGADRLYGLLSVIGGGITVASFFLPWQIGQKVVSSSKPDNLAVQSIWDNISRTAFGSPYADRGTGGTATSTGHVFSALAASMPLIMAVIIVALGMWAVVRRPGSLRTGFFFAAAIVALLTSLSYLLTNPSYYGTGNGTPAVPNESLVSMASVVMSAGLLLLLAAGIATALPRSVPSAPQPSAPQG
jgi:hypothetical protein